MPALPPRSKLPAYVFTTLVVVALGGAVAGRVMGGGPAAETGVATASRDLTFTDNADGSVLVRDTNGATVDVLTGEQGFIRGTLRGLARNRRAEHVGKEPPFRLTSWSDGRLTLTDVATGRKIELEAFGSENVVVFARLLTLPERAKVSLR